MKKIYTALAGLLLTCGAAQAQSILPEGQEFSAKGDQVTTLEDLYTASQDANQLFLLQNHGYVQNNNSGPSFYAQPASGSSLVYEAENALDESALFKLNVTRSGDEGSYAYTVTVQSLSGQYIQGPVNNNPSNTDMTLGAEAVSYTLTLPTGRNANEFWFSYTADGRTWHFNNDGGVPKWHQPGTGAWSRTNVYKANLQAASQRTYTLEVVNAPEGATLTYSLAGTPFVDNSVTVTGSKGTSDLTVSGVPSNYNYTVTLSGSVFTVTFYQLTDISALTDTTDESVIYTISAQPTGTLGNNANQFRGWLYGDSAIHQLNACAGTCDGSENKEVAHNTNDAYQQFAFIKSVDDTWRLYNVGEGRFATCAADGPSALVDSVPQNARLTIAPSVNVQGYTIIKINDVMLNVSHGYTPDIYMTNIASEDEGNRLLVLATGTKLTAEQLAAIHGQLEGETPDTTDTKALVDEAYAALQTAADKAVQYSVGTGLNQYSEATAGTLAAAKTAADALLATKTSTNIDSINAATSALYAAVEGLTLNMPATGTYLRLKNLKTGRYLTAAEGVGTATTMTTAEDADAATIFYFAGNETKSGLVSYTTGEYVTQTGGLQVAEPGTTANGRRFGANTNFVGTYMTYQMNGGWHYLRGETPESATVTGVRNGELADSTYAWTLETVTKLPVALPVQGKNGTYGTLCLPHNTYSVTDDATAYKVTAVADNGELTTKAMDADFTMLMLGINNTVIPAGEPVILVSTNNAESVTVTITNRTGITKSEDNLLQGAQTATAVSADSLYLGLDENNYPGFYATTAQYVTNAAFLAKSASKAGAGYLEDVVTRIEQAVAEANGENAVRYNLAGQRVGKSYKGVVISNGKKMLVK